MARELIGFMATSYLEYLALQELLDDYFALRECLLVDAWPSFIWPFIWLLDYVSVQVEVDQLGYLARQH